MIAPATTTVLVVTALTSWCAFRRPDLKERWMFNPHAILVRRQFERMGTSGLIHADWIHFGFNAYSFYSFGECIELLYGPGTLLLIYLASILGGSLLSLLIHRHHDYRAQGASGGVCGVIFASIFLLPGGSITMFPLPIGIPAYLYAVLFLVGSFVAHRRQAGNIGHDAHLGGAMVGLLVAAIMHPQMIFAAPWLFAAVLGLSLIILIAMIFDPLHLLKWQAKREETLVGGERARRYAENRARNEALAEVDKLLDKVSQQGIHSLTSSERRKLDRLSKTIPRR